MPVASTTVQPSGRGELLLWINSVCTAQYPSVQSLRDGAAYCTIVDAAACRVAENCAALGLPEAQVAQTRAKRASQLLSRVEWNITIVTCANQDPSLDTMQERGHCEKNMQTLQLMLRGCVPTEFCREVNVSRLAEGKLQEHILLLKWMYQFLTKMLSTYSRSALERRVSASDGAGCVEGVRMTRTAKLQQKLVREKYIEPALVESSAGNKTRNTDLRSSTGEELLIPRGNEKKDVGRVMRHPSSFSIGSVSEVSKKEKSEARVGSQRDLLDKGNKCERGSPIPPHQLNIGSSGSEFIFNDGTQLASFNLPHEYFSFLEGLRRDVETFEALALAIYRRHQMCLTRYQDENEECFSGLLSFDEVSPPKKASIITLEQLGLLLEERDKLWQTLEVMQDALVRCGISAEESDRNLMSASPLMQKILSAFFPS